MLDTYIPKIELINYPESNTLFRRLTLQEVLLHYCLNNDIDLSNSSHEEFNVWFLDICAQAYYDLKIHETRQEYEMCLVLKELISNIDDVYEQVKKRFIA